MPTPALSLRPIAASDLPLLLAWRQNQDIIRLMPSASRNLTWKQHYAWWKGRETGSPVYYYMVILKDETGERPIGTVHADFRGEPPEVGIIIGERHAGAGLGAQAMALLLKRLTGTGWRLRAVVHAENQASRKLFETLGFVATGQIVRGQLEYLKELT